MAGVGRTRRPSLDRHAKTRVSRNGSAILPSPTHQHPSSHSRIMSFFKRLIRRRRRSGESHNMSGSPEGTYATSDMTPQATTSSEGQSGIGWEEIHQRPEDDRELIATLLSQQDRAQRRRRSTCAPQSSVCFDVFELTAQPWDLSLEISKA